MQLAEQFRPKRLADVVGQDRPISVLRGFVASPYAKCWCLYGPGGTGKSCTALALASELEAAELDVNMMAAAKLGLDQAEDAIRRLRWRPMYGKWNVLILEEMERLSPQCQQFLKVTLASENLPRSGVVIATSNRLDLIDPALRQRFSKLEFPGAHELASAAAERLRRIWVETAGGELPWNWKEWGWTENAAGKKDQFSMRVALDCLEQALLERTVAA